MARTDNGFYIVPYRVFMMFGYILVSAILVRYLRRAYA